MVGNIVSILMHIVWAEEIRGSSIFRGGICAMLAAAVRIFALIGTLLHPQPDRRAKFSLFPTLLLRGHT